MHYYTLLYLSDYKIEDINDFVLESILDDFGDAFSDSLGERTPTVYDYCDWFEVGGRWAGALKATKGIALSAQWAHGYDEDEKLYNNECNGCNVEDVEEFHYPATLVINNQMIFQHDDNDYYGQNADYREWADKIKSKKIKGVLIVLDCHM